VTSKKQGAKEGVKSKIRCVDSIVGGKPDGDIPTDASRDRGKVGRLKASSVLLPQN
jgi:hypothetical protein